MAFREAQAVMNLRRRHDKCVEPTVYAELVEERA